MRPSAKLWTTPAAVLREEEEGGKEVVVGVFCHQRARTHVKLERNCLLDQLANGNSACRNFLALFPRRARSEW